MKHYHIIYQIVSIANYGFTTVKIAIVYISMIILIVIRQSNMINRQLRAVLDKVFIIAANDCLKAVSGLLVFIAALLAVLDSPIIAIA